MIQQYFWNDVFVSILLDKEEIALSCSPVKIFLEQCETKWNGTWVAIGTLTPTSNSLVGFSLLCEPFPRALPFVPGPALCSGPCRALGWSCISHCGLGSESALTYRTTSSISTPANNPGHSVTQRAGMVATLPPTPVFMCPWVSHFLSLGFALLLARYRELYYQMFAHFFYKGPDNKYFRLFSPHIWVCNNSNLPLQYENTQRQSAKKCV